MFMSEAESKSETPFWHPPVALQQAVEPLRILTNPIFTHAFDHNATLHLVCWTMLLSFTMAVGLSQYWNLPAVSSIDRVFWLACAYVATRAATEMK